jgi:hypothetical protein
MRTVIIALEAGLEPTTSIYATGLWGTIKAMIGDKSTEEIRLAHADWRSRRRMGGGK